MSYLIWFNIDSFQVHAWSRIQCRIIFQINRNFHSIKLSNWTSFQQSIEIHVSKLLLICSKNYLLLEFEITNYVNCRYNLGQSLERPILSNSFFLKNCKQTAENVNKFSELEKKLPPRNGILALPTWVQKCFVSELWYWVTL